MKSKKKIAEEMRQLAAEPVDETLISYQKAKEASELITAELIEESDRREKIFARAFLRLLRAGGRTGADFGDSLMFDLQSILD